MPKIFAFTGTPGTGVQTSIKRFQSFLANRNIEAEYICLDTYLWKEFVSDVTTNNRQSVLKVLNLDESELNDEKQPNWYKLLNLPSDKIREYWEKAAKRAIKEIKDIKKEFVFVSFHANYYSDDYRWRFCAVNFGLLAEFNFSAFFVLIDDIYNILERRDDLLDNIYGEARVKDNKYEKIETLIIRTIDFLKKYILWRQEEIAQTDLFAYSCGVYDENFKKYIAVPSHVLSVKHPMETLKKLIENPNFSVYFSHPITDIRSNESFPNNPEFVEIYNISRDIRQELTLIEPSAIDEMRIKHEDYKHYFPKLTPRWKLLDINENLLLPPQNGSIFKEIVEKLGVKEEFDKFSEGHPLDDEVTRTIQDRISKALYDLISTIKDDITWRDYHLVDQTRRLIVYRPCFNGRPSSGVKSEVQYYQRVCVTNDKSDNIQVVVYHPTEDDKLTREKIANLIIDRLISASGNIGRSLDKTQINEKKDQLIEKILIILNSTESADQVSKEIINEIDSVERFHHVKPINFNPLSPGDFSQISGQTIDIKHEAAMTIRQLLTNDYYISSLKTDESGNVIFVSENNRIKLFNEIKQLKN